MSPSWATHRRIRATALGALLLALVLSLWAQPALARRHRPAQEGLYFGLDYSSGSPSSRLDEFWYLYSGYLADRRNLHIDVSSFFPLGFFDFLIGLARFPAEGDVKPPVWGGLNGGLQSEPGRLKLLSVIARFTLRSKGKQKLDLGGLVDLWSLSPYVVDRHIWAPGAFVGPSLGLSYRGNRLCSTASVEAGNGFSPLALFNPFLGAQAAVRLRLGPVAVYLRLLARAIRLDTSGYEPSDTRDAPPSAAFDQRHTELLVALDAGLIFSLVKTRR